MAIITAIEVQKRNKNRVNLYLDGEFAIGLDTVAAMSARLKAGDSITLGQLQDIALKSDVNSAFNKAVNKMASRMNSQKEITSYLYQKGYSTIVIDEAISRLKSYGYIDDKAFANAFVQSHAHKMGKMAIKQRLSLAGVSSEIIDEMLEYDDSAGARQAAEKYMRTHKNDPIKLYNYLRGKGFNHDISKEISKSLQED